jgi:hypothetical protein
MYKVAARNLRSRRARSKRVAQPRGKKDKKSLRQVEARSRKRIEKLEIGRVYSGIVVKVLESGVLVDIGKVWGKLDARLMMGQLVPVKVVSIDMRYVFRGAQAVRSRRHLDAGH